MGKREEERNCKKIGKGGWKWGIFFSSGSGNCKATQLDFNSSAIEVHLLQLIMTC